MVLGYGDLVVLVNPAIEAMRYEPLRLLVDERYWHDPDRGRYAPRQPPVFVQVTSVGATAFQGDWATGVAFPIGRALNSLLEPKRDDAASGESELDLALTAMGHHEAFWTHELTVAAGRTALVADGGTVADCRSFLAFRHSAEASPGYLRPGWTRVYDSGAELRDLANPRFNPNTPFWMVRASPRVIPDHNAIESPVFVNFVAQLSSDVDRLRDPELCGEATSDAGGLRRARVDRSTSLN